LGQVAAQTSDDEDQDASKPILNLRTNTGFGEVRDPENAATTVLMGYVAVPAAAAPAVKHTLPNFSAAAIGALSSVVDCYNM
jgi:hypothetical protein